MSSRRCTVARFLDATPRRADGAAGVALRFRPERSRLPIDFIEDWADLGPALTIPAVGGLGKVLRLLRAARIALPADPLDLVGQEQRAADLLQRARGTSVRLEVKPRFRRRFVAWTERGVESVDGVAEVREYDDCYLVTRDGGRAPLRFERAALVRQRTEAESWYEVLDIERV